MIRTPQEQLIYPLQKKPRHRLQASEIPTRATAKRTERNNRAYHSQHGPATPHHPIEKQDRNLEPGKGPEPCHGHHPASRQEAQCRKNHSQHLVLIAWRAVCSIETQSLPLNPRPTSNAAHQEYTAHKIGGNLSYLHSVRRKTERHIIRRYICQQNNYDEVGYDASPLRQTYLLPINLRRRHLVINWFFVATGHPRHQFDELSLL